MAKSDQRPILLVEDDDDDVFLFKRALKRAGLENPVSVVFGVAMAKAYLEGEGEFTDRSAHPFPAVLVVDLRLPDGTGLELLQWVREQPQFQGLHRIVVTGDDRLSVAQDCYALGVDSFLRKPCGHGDLRIVADGYPQHWGVDV